MALPFAATLVNGAASAGAQNWPGGSGLLAAVGTFGGASVQLQFLGPDGATWLNVGAAITTAGSAAFALPPGKIQATVTGGSGIALNVNAQLVPVVVA